MGQAGVLELKENVSKEIDFNHVFLNILGDTAAVSDEPVTSRKFVKNLLTI